MAFIIKNVRDHVVHVDGVPINPGEQLIVRHTMTGPISKALDAGDVQLDDGDEPREGIHAVVEPVEHQAVDE
jgi:hypothetical protein